MQQGQMMIYVIYPDFLQLCFAFDISFPSPGWVAGLRDGVV